MIWVNVVDGAPSVQVPTNSFSSGFPTGTLDSEGHAGRSVFRFEVWLNGRLHGLNKVGVIPF